MSEKQIRVGQRVEVPSKDTFGTIAFAGNTNFSTGKWIGVVLDEKKGKNNGTIQGKTYFQCEDGFGVFVRQSQVNVIEGDEDDASSDTTKSSAASAGTTPTAERPKSSLRRKPIGSQVPQKPDRLRLPTSGKSYLTRGYGFGSPSYPLSQLSPQSPCTVSNLSVSHSSLNSSAYVTPPQSISFIAKTPLQHSSNGITGNPPQTFSHSEDDKTSQLEMMKPLSQTELAITPCTPEDSQISKASKASSQTNLSKTPSQTSLTKTPSQSSLTKTPSQSSLTKTPSQSSLTKTQSQSNLTKTPSQTSLTKTSSQTSLGKTGSQSNLSKTPSQTSINKTSQTNVKTSTQTNPRTPQSFVKSPQTPSGNRLLTKMEPNRTPFLASPFRKPFAPYNLKSGSASSRNSLQPKLPLGSVTKVGPGQKGGKDEKASAKESPRQDPQKTPSFVEGVVPQGVVPQGVVPQGVVPQGVVPSTDASVKGADADNNGVDTTPQGGVNQTNFVETLTSQFTPGPTSGAMHTLGDKANAAQAQQDIENLKAEITDLNEKLETLRFKRAQDKDKLKDGEKLRLQVEQLIEFKSRIMESQASLQKDLQKARQEAKEAVEARDLHVEETQELMESVEMLTLDKEMAEEKAEALQMECDQLREKVEELTLDLEIIKAEDAEEEDGPVKIETKPSASLEVKQLEQQNARLRDTLVRMRDISAHDKHELQKAQKELEGRKSEVTELTRNKEKVAEQLTEMETTIADLQEQVDAALGAEEMCETLTERNLNLEERVVELLETVADLEAINDMNDQLQENARDLELELREELDMANAKIREVIREREASNEVIVDQDTTIKKFRDLVQKMQEQNLDLRHALEKETNKPMATPNEVIDFKKMFTETKAQSKAIDLELRRLEVQQANQHVTYLTQYLPNTFMNRGGDHDAVLVLLLLPRMIWKADIVIGGLRDHQVPIETIDRSTILKSHSVDQFSFSSRMLQMLYMLQAMLKQYLHVLNSCSVDLFLKMGTLFPEMAAHERNLDFYIDLLRKDQLDENVMTEQIEKTVSYFQTVYPAHLANEKLDQTSYLCDVAKVFNSASQAIRTEASRVEVLLPPSEVTSSEVGGFLTTLKGLSTEIEGSVKRVRRRMPQDGSSGPVSYPKHVQDTLTTSMSALYNASRALRLVAKTCMQQTSLIADADGGIPNDKLKEFLHQATDLVYGSEDQGPDSVRNSMSLAEKAIGDIAVTLEKGEYDFDGTAEKESIPPMSLRAESIKNELKDTEHLKSKLEMKETDLKDLKLALKQKNEELSEMTVRRDMAEKKLSTATRDADITIEKLQRKLDDTLMALRRKEKEYDETMDHLQADIESLEFEKGELREKLKTLNKRTLYEALSRSAPLGSGVGSPSSPTTPSGVGSVSAISSTTSSGVVVKDSPLLLHQIADLKAALNSAYDAKHTTVALDIQKKLASLRPLKVSQKSLLRLGGGDDDEKRDLEKEEMSSAAGKESSQRLNELTKQTVDLQKELRELITGVQVVDLTKRKAGVVPTTQSSAPVSHLINYKSKVLAIQCRIHALQDEITKLVAERKPAGSVTTALASFPSPQLVKAGTEKQPIKIGQVIVPSDQSSSSTKGPVSVILQPEHFRSLHMKLLN